MSDLKSSDAHAALEAVLGHRFRDGSLLETALAHASYSHEIDGSRGNERLEFLGDAVLDVAVSLLLYDAHPTWSEGDLTRARASVVNTRSLARHAHALGFGKYARLGASERKTGGSEKERVLANVFEALMAALYLDAGIQPVLALARRLFSELLVPGSLPLAADPKTRLNEWSHVQHRTTPRYVVVADSGIEADLHRFVVEARVLGESIGRGEGRTKRAAERAAAESALARIAG